MIRRGALYKMLWPIMKVHISASALQIAYFAGRAQNPNLNTLFNANMLFIYGFMHFALLPRISNLFCNAFNVILYHSVVSWLNARCSPFAMAHAVLIDRVALLPQLAVRIWFHSQLPMQEFKVHQPPLHLLLTLDNTCSRWWNDASKLKTLYAMIQTLDLLYKRRKRSIVQ